jgi:hypothetical protein
VLGGIVEDGGESLNGGGVLALAETIGNFVAKES